MTNVGIPFGEDEYCKQYWMKKLLTVETEITHLCKWTDLQVSMILFRLCCVTQMNYMLRNIPFSASYAEEIKVKTSKLIQEGFKNLTGIQDAIKDDDNNWWEQATLPCTKGGFGLPDPIQIHKVSFLASEVNSIKLMTTLTRKQLIVPDDELFLFSNDAKRCFTDFVLDKENYKDIYDLCEEDFNLQHLLVGQHQQLKRDNLLQKSDNIRIRINSASNEGSYLITAIPKFDNLKISNPLQMRERWCARLGLRIDYIKPIECLCSRKIDKKTKKKRIPVFLDTKGVHLNSICPCGNQRQQTHDTIKMELYKLIKACGYFNCAIEDNTLIKNIDNTINKRVDLNIFQFSGNKSMGIDISVTDPRCPAFRDSTKPGSAAKLAEKKKISKYELFYTNDFFEPFVMEALGRWGERANTLFQILIQQLHVIQSYIPEETLMTYWKTRISVAMHKAASKGCFDRYTLCSKTNGSKRNTSYYFNDIPDEEDLVDFNKIRSD